MSSPNLKYAHIERERRFLLASVPAQLAVTAVWNVFDRYVSGTGLRLRMIMHDNQPPIYKFGQKIRLNPGSARTLAHTTMYLSAPEYAALAQLPADPLHKTRHVLTHESNAWAIDVFHDELEGLVLAEIDLGDDRPMPMLLPVEPLVEVTDDDRFTGGRLAQMKREELHALLARPPAR